MADLAKLAQKIVSEGPHKAQPATRRVRGIFNGKYVFDTIEAYHVWEHPYYPQLYIPTGAFTSSATLKKLSPVPNTNESAYLGRLTVDSKSTDRVIIFATKQLPDLVRIEFSALDHWFEENLSIYIHPKDPYKRIDILPSSRSIKIGLHGETLAETDSALLLLETSLRTRYYLPATCVKWELLRKSDTETFCPYKGKAEYYHVVLPDGTELRDAVWYYRYTTAECAAVAGCLCFYNEKVDVWVDGVKEEK